MKKKQLIIISAAVLCVLVAVFVVCAVKGSSASDKNNEELTAVSDVSETSSEQTAQSGGAAFSASQPSETDEPQANGSTEEKSTAEPGEKNTKTDTARETSAQTAASAERNTSAQQNKTITVSVAVNCKNAVRYCGEIVSKGKEYPLDITLPSGGYIITQKNITLKEGQTVFDALEAACSQNGVSLKYQSKSYITGIGGLNEKDCGGASGWMYRVNGVSPNKGASKYTLKNGDSVEWYYVTNSKDN